MAGENNPFYVQPVNPLQALMQGEEGYKFGRGIAQESTQNEGRQEAMRALQSGGDLRTPLAKLIGVGDFRGANAIASFAQHQAQSQGVYGTPIMLQQSDGSYKVGAIGKSGEGRVVDFGPGNAPTVPSKAVDVGTGTYVIPGRVAGGSAVPGAPVLPGQPQPGGQPPQAQRPVPIQGPVPTQGYYPKDVAGKAQQQKFGTEQGEAQANLVSMQAKLPSLRESVKELEKLGDQATYTVAGQLLDKTRRQFDFDPRKEALARAKYIAMVDNQILPLLRETFGAQFTQREGESLKITLGDPDKSPKEKRVVLDAFIEQKVRNIESTARQVGQQPQAGSAQPPKIGALVDGYRFKGGDPADPASWVKAK